MVRRMIADSSINCTQLPGADFATVPMKVIAGDRTYVDDETCDVHQMVKDLAVYKGRTGTACPSPDEWLDAFGDAEEIFCITISSSLSGSYNAAQVAARDYRDQHPDRRVLVIDSLSTGGEMLLIAEMIARMIADDAPFDDIAAAVADFPRHNNLIFCLQSVRSLANNGRLSPAIAALIGMLGVRLIGCASEKGELEMVSKCRGDKKALSGMLDALSKLGYIGGRLHIDHCNNPALASSLASSLRARFPSASITLGETRALCSYYAEEGGLIVGFATA